MQRTRHCKRTTTSFTGFVFKKKNKQKKKKSKNKREGKEVARVRVSEWRPFLLNLDIMQRTRHCKRTTTSFTGFVWYWTKQWERNFFFANTKVGLFLLLFFLKKKSLKRNWLLLLLLCGGKVGKQKHTDIENQPKKRQKENLNYSVFSFVFFFGFVFGCQGKDLRVPFSLLGLRSERFFRRPFVHFGINEKKTG